MRRYEIWACVDHLASSGWLAEGVHKVSCSGADRGGGGGGKGKEGERSIHCNDIDNQVEQEAAKHLSGVY